jgi:hypothetical protein
MNPHHAEVGAGVLRRNCAVVDDRILAGREHHVAFCKNRPAKEAMAVADPYERHNLVHAPLGLLLVGQLVLVERLKDRQGLVETTLIVEMQTAKFPRALGLLGRSVADYGKDSRQLLHDETGTVTSLEKRADLSGHYALDLWRLWWRRCPGYGRRRRTPGYLYWVLDLGRVLRCVCAGALRLPARTWR